METPTEGRHFGVLSWYVSCTGKNVPDMAPENTAVICLLSSIPAISTLFNPLSPWCSWKLVCNGYQFDPSLKLSQQECLPYL